MLINPTFVKLIMLLIGNFGVLVYSVVVLMSNVYYDGSGFHLKTKLNKCAELSVFCTHHGLIFISGMGAHVKKTVSSKKDLRPHTSDNAPIRGALRNDNRPWEGEREGEVQGTERLVSVNG